MTENNNCALMQCGRRISEQEIEQICETVELFPRLALSELVATICEHLGWHTAAGWEYLGMTTGEGLVRQGRTYTTSPKRIFVKPLVDDFRRLLCSEFPAGRVEE